METSILEVQSHFTKISSAKTGQLSIVNSVLMYEAQITVKSVSNKVAFHWLAW